MIAKIAIIALNDINRYPALFYIAEKLSRDGHDVTLLSRQSPNNLSKSIKFQIKFKWVQIEEVTSLLRLIPIARGNSHGILKKILAIKPDLVIGQHQYAAIGVLYKKIVSINRKVIAGVYYSDYIEKGFNASILKLISRQFDLYIDICKLRVEWKKNDWRKFNGKTFVIQQATPKSNKEKIPTHSGQTKIIFTGSDYGDGMQWDLLRSLIRKICESNIVFDWYLPGTDTLRAKAKELLNNPNYHVHNPVSKSELLVISKNYDFGLFWAPYSEITAKLNKSIYVSAASNKICEYQSAGLGVVHTGNPGLSYLPTESSIAIDPWNLETSISKLIEIISNRQTVEKMRLLSFEYHKNIMNSDAQIKPLSDYISENL